MTRTLILRREALSVLSVDDLAVVAGGQWSGDAFTCGLRDCLLESLVTTPCRCVSLTNCPTP